MNKNQTVAIKYKSLSVLWVVNLSKVKYSYWKEIWEDSSHISLVIVSALVVQAYFLVHYIFQSPSKASVEILRIYQQREFFYHSKMVAWTGGAWDEVNIRTRGFGFSENQVMLMSENLETEFVFISCRLLNFWVRPNVWRLR